MDGRRGLHTRTRSSTVAFTAAWRTVACGSKSRLSPSTWTAFKNSVDVIDGNTGTVATVVAAPAGDLDSSSDSFYNCIFSPDGKIQRAGTPIDEFKVLSVRDGVLPGYKEVALKFTAVSPNSRLIDRRAVATATQIGATPPRHLHRRDACFFAAAEVEGRWARP